MGAYDDQVRHDLAKARKALREAENELAMWRQRGRCEDRLRAAWQSARRRAADLRIAEEHIARGNEETNKAYARLRTAESRLAAVRALHVEEYGCCTHCTGLYSEPAPCPTIQALNGDPT